MRLRRVVITGFKTFARRVEVRLEPGITAIVGPNGSGKSNLVDAIRWALGETNARELRGARMDEVIYSGGGGRGRMGFAEVELILDNEDGRLAVDDVEVSVSRRVVRHGDSEFRLNGDRVRLRDVERVLGTTGLTQTGYAVVAQNDIDAIIEASPAQRRALVEQAAGVRFLRAACEDSLGRVSAAEITLRRFEDLLAENEPRLVQLAAQAALALEQRQLTERLVELRGSLAREEWRSARAQLRQAQRRLDAAAARLEAARTADRAFTEGLDRQRAHLERQRAARSEAAARLERTRLRVERADGDRRRGEDRVRDGAVRRAQASLDARTAAAEVTARAAEVAAMLGQGRSAIERRDRLEAAVAAAREVHDVAATRQATAERDLAAAEDRLRAADEARATAVGSLHHSAARLQLVTDGADELERRRQGSRTRVTERATAAAEASAAESSARDAVVAAERAHLLAANSMAAARLASDSSGRDLQTARDAARTALARAASLRGQVEGAVGGRGGIADAVDAGEIAARRLVDCFTVADPADAAAVEAALEHHLGSWVVDDLDTAAAHLGSGGREEILWSRPPVPAAAAGAPAGARTAIAAVHATTGAEQVLTALLAGTWLVPDLVSARRAVAAGGGRAVLPDGRVLTAAGLRGGGRPGRTLELAATEQEAARRAADAVQAERGADDVRRVARERLAAAEIHERRAADTLQAARLRLVEAAANAATATAAHAAEEQRLGEVEAEIGTRSAERRALADEEGRAAAAVRAAEDARTVARDAATQARDELVEWRAAVSRSGQELQDAEAEATAAAVASTDHERRVATAVAAQREADARLGGALDRLLTAELAVLAGIARHGAAARDMAAAATAVEDALQGLDASAPDLSASERAVARLEAERSEVAVALARAEDEAAAAAREVTDCDDRVAALADAVRDDGEDDGPEPEAGAAEAAEREIVRLERRVTALGPVNALAPDEHDRLAIRVATLRAGRDDLGAACGDIRAMAARLTTEVERRFDAVFGAVSVHFHELFAELFPGGRATLRREEVAPPPAAEAVADRGAARAGVEILAQPPGKKLQPLSLLSGGERALTALAVILALQQVTPSPFYVFDEVDAPLDDSNVLRFSRLLTRLAAGQQFIVVTHNHVTMAAADVLHGVTSDGDGVSSVISVRFDPGAGETIAEGNVVGLRQSTIRAAV